MKIKTVGSILICALFLLCSTSDALAKKKKKVKLENEKDKISYTIGANMAQSLIPLGKEINLDKVLMGITDRYSNKDLLISDAEIQTIMREFSTRMQKKMVEDRTQAAERNVTEGVSFLKENKEKKGVETTESGLQYMILKEGDGPIPTAADKVSVHYKGMTLDGKEFDSSYKRGIPATFPVAGVIKGWGEALQLMKVGGKYKLFIPSDLAYGERGAGANIGPNAVLIFEVELLGIEN